MRQEQSLNTINTTFRDGEAPITTICVIGAGYVGGVMSALVACWNPEIQVLVVDRLGQRIEQWQSDRLPINEPGLLQIVEKARDVQGNLRFTNNMEQALSISDAVFLCVNTPSCKVHELSPLNLDFLEQAMAEVINHARKLSMIVVRSTVPVGTAEKIRHDLATRDLVHVQVLSNPEFMAEGSAVFNTLWPDRVVIGHASSEAGCAAARRLAEIYMAWLDERSIKYTSNAGAELSKLASNTLLAQRIADSNAISMLCSQHGCNTGEVLEICGLDSRLGMLPKPGLGYGGPCLVKDVGHLAYEARSDANRNPIVEEICDAILRSNHHLLQHLTTTLAEELQHIEYPYTIALFGFSFKKNSINPHNSVTARIAAHLLCTPGIGELRIYDRRFTESVVLESVGDLGPRQIGRLVVSTSLADAVGSTHAIIIVTDHPEFRCKKRPSGTQVPGSVWDTKNRLASRTTREDFERSLNLGLMEEMPKAPGFDLIADIFKNEDELDDFRQLHKCVKACNVTGECCDGEGVVKAIRWDFIHSRMLGPRLVVDGRSFLDGEVLENMGFRFRKFGWPAGTTS